MSKLNALRQNILTDGITRRRWVLLQSHSPRPLVIDLLNELRMKFVFTWLS